MSTITRICKVGSDGNVLVPVGADHAGEDVRVDVSPARPGASAAAMTPEDYRTRIASLAGSWAGDFQEPEDLSFEHRDEL
jgi:hypothetical protein